MKASKRLQPVVKVTDRREKDAAAALGKVQQELENNRQRLVELKSYRLEYASHLSQSQPGQFSGSKLKDYQSFLNNLDRAIEQQKQVIVKFKQDYERQKRQWLTARNRKKAVNSLLDKHILAEEKQQERKIQSEVDDRFSTQMAKKRDS